MKTSQKGSIRIIILLMIVIAAGIGTFYLVKNKSTDLPLGYPASEPADVNPSVVSHADDAIEFDYPAGYSIKDISPKGFKNVNVSKGDINVMIADIPTSFTTGCGDDGCAEYAPKETISGFSVTYYKLPNGYLALAHKSGFGYYVAASASNEETAKGAEFSNTLKTILGSVTKPMMSYKNTFYSFSYPKNWGVWEQNASQGIVVAYPNAIEAQIINKTYSNSDTINFSFVDTINVDQTDLAKAEKITLNGLTWSFHVQKVPFDGGTPNVSAIEYVRKYDERKYILVHSASGNKPMIDAVLATYIQR